MKNTRLNPKIVLLIIISILFGVPFVLIGCGALDNNTQPTLDPISDKTLDVSDERTVDVYITDADVDDTHIINASSDNPSVATVSVDENSVIITGKAVGMTTITVTATDDSGQDNATSTPVTFEVTVNEPPPSAGVTIGLGINQPPVSFINKGMCAVGMTLKPGEGCSYDSNEFFAEINFFVRDDGTACREQVPKVIEGIEIPEHLRPRNLKFCVEWNIEPDDFFNTNFAAIRNPNGSWTVKSVP